MAVDPGASSIAVTGMRLTQGIKVLVTKSNSSRPTVYYPRSCPDVRLHPLAMPGLGLHATAQNARTARYFLETAPWLAYPLRSSDRRGSGLSSK